MRWLVVAAVCCACRDKQAPPKNEFEAYERRFLAEIDHTVAMQQKAGQPIPDEDIPTSFRAVYVGPPGLFVDRKLVATLAELDTKRAAITAALDANAKLMPTIRWTQTVVLDLDLEPAPVATTALRVFAGRKLIYEVPVHDAEAPWRASEIICAGTTLRDHVVSEPERVNLSLLLAPERMWVGLSRVSEFQEIPDRAKYERDFDKLEVTLKEHKASAFFADRDDVELGAESGTARADHGPRSRMQGWL